MEWKDDLGEHIRTIEQLGEHVSLTKKEKREIKKVIDIHPMRITKYYLSLINKNDKDDPIRKMTYSHDLKVGVSMQWHDVQLDS
jgi:L-lysine 2,3-aminomutase